MQLRQCKPADLQVIIDLNEAIYAALPDKSVDSDTYDALPRFRHGESVESRKSLLSAFTNKGSEASVLVPVEVVFRQQ